MAARTFSWTTAAQVRRIAAVDTRLIGIDIAYGLFYVLAGFFLTTDDKNLVHVVVLPFVMLSGVLIYMTHRLCGPEGAETTAMFYANLPRPRRLAYWAHAAWLCAFALSMEAVIGLGMVLRLNADLPDQQLVVTPFLLVLPFFAIVFGMWKTYYHHHITLRVFLDILVVLATVVAFICVFTMDIGLRRSLEKTSHVTTWEYFSPALFMTLLTVLLFWYVSQRWRKIQLGEVS